MKTNEYLLYLLGKERNFLNPLSSKNVILNKCKSHLVHLTFATCGTASCSKTLGIFALTLVFSLNMNWKEEDETLIQTASTNSLHKQSNTKQLQYVLLA